MVYQTANVTFNVIGDGVSVLQYLDLTKDIEAAFGQSSFQHSPANGIVVLDNPSLTIAGITYTSSTTVIGNVVVITWSAAIPLNSSGASSINLGY